MDHLFSIPGPTQYYALLNDSLSLICGTGLDSNPRANITWTAPDGTTVMSDSRYHLENGPDTVRLNIANTSLYDSGMWQCEITVESEQHIVNNGKLLNISDPMLIGAPINRKLQVVIIGKIVMNCGTLNFVTTSVL